MNNERFGIMKITFLSLQWMFDVINIPQFMIIIIIKHGYIMIAMVLPNSYREYGAALIEYLEFSP